MAWTDQLEQRFSPYALAGDPGPYDLVEPGRIREIKRALWALAQWPAIAFWKEQPIEQLWSSLSDDDSWTDDAMDEYLVAISRLTADKSDVTMPAGPYVVFGLTGPQPSATGVRMLDTEVNTRAASYGEPYESAKMTLWEESWHGEGESPGTTIPTLNVPAQPAINKAGSPQSVTAAKQAYATLLESWTIALEAKDETQRLAAVNRNRAAREAFHVAALRTQGIEPAAPVPLPLPNGKAPEPPLTAGGGNGGGDVAKAGAIDVGLVVAIGIAVLLLFKFAEKPTRARA